MELERQNNCHPPTGWVWCKGNKRKGNKHNSDKHNSEMLSVDWEAIWEKRWIVKDFL